MDYKITPHCEISNQCGGCSHGLFFILRKTVRIKSEQIIKLLDNAGLTGYEFLGIEGSPNELEYRNKMEFTFGDMEKRWRTYFRNAC